LFASSKEDEKKQLVFDFAMSFALTAWLKLMAVDGFVTEWTFHSYAWFFHCCC